MSDAPDLSIPDGVSESAWNSIAKAQGNRWAIAERDASGEVVGTVYRDAVGKKTCEPGGKRGLILRWPLGSYAGTSEDNPIYVCEGASDTGALLGLGLDAIGVPMAGHCADMLAELLAGLHVVIVADADAAGRSGARKIADALLPSCVSVRIIEPPEGAKDARAAVLAGADRQAFEQLAREAEPIRPALANGDPIIVRLADVRSEDVDWLWAGRFALGKLTLIAGDPGLGKSLVTLDMAARVSRGAPWPDSPHGDQLAGGVVLLSAEDGIADTIRPRLDAAGADVNRIVALEAVYAPGQNGRESARLFDLARDLPALEHAIAEVESCRLVVIDPVSAYLGAVDSHKNAEVRGLLAPLGDIAARHRVAMVAVTHLNKSTAGPAIYRTMGSLAFTAAARAAWGVCKDKEDQQRRLLLPIKNNLAPDAGGLAYRIESRGAGGSPVVAWEPDPVTGCADDALGGSGNESGGALDEALDWLRDMLCDGPVPAGEVKDAAKRDGIAARTLARAKKELGVLSTREGYSSKGRWVWAMPHSVPAPQPESLAHNEGAGALCESNAVSEDQQVLDDEQAP